MAEEKTVEELINELYEIDNRIYTEKMRLKSIESNFERVAPLFRRVRMSDEQCAADQRRT